MNRRAVAALLAPHVGHAVVVVDDVQLRCHACAVTLVLDSGRAVMLAPDQLLHVDLTSLDPCRVHLGNTARRYCGGCRADRLAGHSE